MNEQVISPEIDCSRRLQFRVALVALLLAVLWLTLNVCFNYQGHISGLFYTGATAQIPAPLEAHTYRVKDEKGYDAVFYHMIAHDPLIRRGFIPYVDNPQLRWRRIGVPALASLLAAGSDRFVDYTYVAIQLAFVFLGAFWLSCYAKTCNTSALWGLAFLLIPAVLVSLDRMTIDLPLAALCIALVLYGSKSGPQWPIYSILCAAPLVRETGMVLVVAWCICSALRRRWSAALLGAACAAPAILWWAYVRSRLSMDGTPWLSQYPFSGLIERTIQGTGNPTFTAWLRVADAFEWLALAGIWFALLLALYFLFRRRPGLIELTTLVFMIFAATLGKYDIWASAYATGRTMSPLLIMLGIFALKERRYLFALPLLLILPRMALQYEAQLTGIIRGIVQ
jgi:hypothetical protein